MVRRTGIQPTGCLLYTSDSLKEKLGTGVVVLASSQGADKVNLIVTATAVSYTHLDINARTQGEIYIGVVGPVRSGKSTFIKHFAEKLILPFMSDLSLIHI